MPPTRGRRVAVAMMATAALAAASPSAAQGALEVLETRQLTPRLFDLTMRTDALAAPVHTRILLPDGYAANPRKRYPVLWLLHGGFDHVPSWTEKGAAEEITAGKDLIVVMPEDGNGGWYSDWHNGGRGGPPRWETFHIEQLLPWVDATYRTIPDRRARGVAGLSTGGFGTMHYAARHPDLFSYAASFSGALDIVGNAPVAPVIALEAMADGGGPDDPFGNRITHAIGWRAQNPLDLAGNLRGLTLEVITGTGSAGPHDDLGTFDPIEHQVHEMSTTFHRRLTELGIAHRWQVGPGTHSWPYWQEMLRAVVPRMLSMFAAPRPAPRPFTYTSADDSFAVWGWSIEMRRGAQAFVTLRDADRRGFRMEGAGSAEVVTASYYRPSAPLVVTAQGRGERIVDADAAGRLRLTVPLATRTAAPTAVRVEESLLAGLPPSTSRRQCLTRRRFDLRLQGVHGLEPRSVEVRLDGRRAALHGAAVSRLRLDLRRARPGRHRVTIVVRGAYEGREVTFIDRRSYRTCQT